MEQKEKLKILKYNIGASKITFSTYVDALFINLEKHYNKVTCYMGDNKKRILKISSNSSRFSLIISEENRNRDYTIINIKVARISNEEFEKLEDKIDIILGNIFETYTKEC